MLVHKLRHDRPSGWFSKSRGLPASVSFLSSPPPPHSFTCTIFREVSDFRSSFVAPKPHGNAWYAGYHNVRAVTKGGGRGISPEHEPPAILMKQTKSKENRTRRISSVKLVDQFRFQGNCPPSPPLSQH